jgi:peptidoglycan/xylan/chitin deacetylase (PgdA/CDA1 family)
MLDWFTPMVFLGRAQLSLWRRGTPVLAWHRVSSPPAQTRDPFLHDSPKEFARQLSRLAAAGWQAAGLSSVDGSEAIAGGNVVLTFDDGFADVLENGLPLLQKHRFHAIQFLVAGMIGGHNEWDVRKGDIPQRLMTREEVRSWLASGMEIGSHSMTHQNLRHLNSAQAREEIAGSKKKLEDLFAVPIRHFSYPFGSWNGSVRELVAEAGYETACTMDFGINPPDAPRLALKRVFPLSSGRLVSKVGHRLLRKCGLR